MNQVTHLLVTRHDPQGKAYDTAFPLSTTFMHAFNGDASQTVLSAHTFRQAQSVGDAVVRLSISEIFENIADVRQPCTVADLREFSKPLDLSRNDGQHRLGRRAI